MITLYSFDSQKQSSFWTISPVRSFSVAMIRFNFETKQTKVTKTNITNILHRISLFPSPEHSKGKCSSIRIYPILWIRKLEAEPA